MSKFSAELMKLEGLSHVFSFNKAQIIFCSPLFLIEPKAIIHRYLDFDDTKPLGYHVSVIGF